MMMTPRILTNCGRAIVALLTIATSTACGGGGSGGSTLSNDSCSVIGPKIFDGTACSGKQLPVVQIEVIYSDRPPSFCSGSVIAPSAVLTAGHCFPDRGAAVSQVAVVFSDTVIYGAAVHIHPDYRESPEQSVIFNDVAVVTLSQSVSVTPLPILASIAPIAGDTINIFGFGFDEQGNSGALKSGQMELSLATPDHLFAIFGNSGSNTCLGDSGGPAIVELPSGTSAIAGVTSSGDPESQCRRGDLSVFTNLQSPSVESFLRAQVPNLTTLRILFGSKH